MIFAALKYTRVNFSQQKNVLTCVGGSLFLKQFHIQLFFITGWYTRISFLLLASKRTFFSQWWEKCQFELGRRGGRWTPGYEIVNNSSQHCASLRFFALLSKTRIRMARWRNLSRVSDDNYCSKEYCELTKTTRFFCVLHFTKKKRRERKRFRKLKKQFWMQKSVMKLSCRVFKASQRFEKFSKQTNYNTSLKTFSLEYLS